MMWSYSYHPGADYCPATVFYFFYTLANFQRLQFLLRDNMFTCKGSHKWTKRPFNHLDRTSPRLLWKVSKQSCMERFLKAKPSVVGSHRNFSPEGEPFKVPHGVFQQILRQVRTSV